MSQPLHDALIEIAEAYARVRTLTPHARHWVEAHVTVAQVRLWCDGVLEVPPHVISDLLPEMLTTGLKLIPPPIAGFSTANKWGRSSTSFACVHINPHRKPNQVLPTFSSSP